VLKRAIEMEVSLEAAKREGSQVGTILLLRHWNVGAHHLQTVVDLRSTSYL